MKFLYEYRTSDNAKHNGVIHASDREAAYAQLKAQGIRPSRFAEAPGLLNKIFGKGKRWIAIALLAVALVATIVYYVSTLNKIAPKLTTVNSLEATTRRQVIGDTAIIEKGIRTGWADVFENEGERFLASFSVPGVPAGTRNTSEAEISAALSRQIAPTEADGIEARQIKSMVEGMKDEARRFLANGGTIQRYGQRLVERQEFEIGCYNRVKNELDAIEKSGKSGAELEAIWEDRNAKLRKMGVKLVPMPEQ